MKINPAMVTLAREFRELTQEELSTRIKVGQAKIAKIESGIQPDVSEEMVADLCSALDVPANFFFQNAELVGFGSSAYFYRKKADLTAKDRKRIHAVINLLRIHLSSLLKSVEIASKRNLPFLDIDDFGGAAARVAQAVRQFWNVPDGPISNLTTLIESAGVIVVPVDFGTKSMDATSLRLSDMPPLIFINSELPGDRWRFTLAHELAHLVMHDVPNENMESEADAFASEFLMPEVEMKPIFSRMGNPKLEDLAKLKLFWKTSMAAILRRLDDLGFISAYKKRSLWISLRSMGIQEPNSFERENPKTYSKIIKYFTDTLNYSAENLEKTLFMHARDLNHLHAHAVSGALAPQRLRLVS